MANKLLNWAFKQTDLVGAAKWVLVVLANRADKTTHQCFPSLTQIANDAGIHRSTVPDCIQQLVDKRKIRREKRGAQNTLYTLLLVAPGDQQQSPQATSSPTRLVASGNTIVASGDSCIIIDKPKLTIEENPPTPQRGIAAARRRDLAADIFVEAHQEFRRTKYKPKKGDWVQLAEVRQTQNVKPYETPESWQQTCRNYFNSTLPNYTLADMCARYSIFFNGSVDRYNRPIGGNNGFGQHRVDNNTRRAHELLGEIAAKNSGSGKRGTEQGDDGRLRRTPEQTLFGEDSSGDDPHD